MKLLDLDSLNQEFEKLLEKHESDMCVWGASKEEFIEEHSQEEDFEKNLWAMAYNAWDELCENHSGLRESGLGWFCGAQFVGYDNHYDLYIGTGDEEYK